MGEVQARMEALLARVMPAAHVAPARLHEAMRYAALGGGKRVRPLLTFAAGALIRAAVLIGAACGHSLGALERAGLDRYAKAVGLAFQVVDDLLDYEGSTATLGKTAGKDSKQGKPTYVSAIGVARARELAEELRADAHAALAALGARGARLASLADFVVLRKF